MAESTEVARDKHLYWHKGFCFMKEMMPPEFVDSMKDLKIRDDDVFLITYPKSGTIWTQQILSLICCEGHRNGTEKFETNERVQWLDVPIQNPELEHDKRPSPRLFVSHFSQILAPRGLKNSKAKVIYVMRNPKDVMKSYYHFQNIVVLAEASPDFQHFFEKFLDGEGPMYLALIAVIDNVSSLANCIKYQRFQRRRSHPISAFPASVFTSSAVYAGKWFDHIRGWYTHKNEYNILFLQYEDMIKDLRSVVKQISTFLGVKLDDEAIDLVVKKATFKEMKKDPLANKESMPENIIDKRFGSFMRKGQVGDWKNTMTVAQSELFDKLLQEKMGDLSLNFTWQIPE